jgi:UDP-N-acetylmuramoyl-L-alanyl-D-glutamate--2,6-diaminopimelate ligase
MITMDDMLRLPGVVESRSPAGPSVRIEGIAYDSRKVVPGGAFFAVRGFVMDGHRFIDRAIGNGASVIVCEEFPEVCPQECSWIRVQDCRKALSRASAAWYGFPAGSLRVIGVTGTNGKTTTARLIHRMLVLHGVPAGYIGTGLALAGKEEVVLERTTPEALELHELFLKMVSSGCEAAVMEVSSHALVLDRTADITFSGAVFTNLTPEHLDFHGSMDAYGRAKARLFSQVARDGFGVVNADDPWSGEMARVFSGSKLLCTTCQDQKFPCRSGSLVRALDIEASMDGSCVRVGYEGISIPASFRLPGLYNVMNMLGVYAAGFAMGLDPQRVVSSLSAEPSVPGRLERVSDDEGRYTAVVDYAHTPDALEKVIDALNAIRPEGSRLIVVFGCGGDRDRSKRPVMGEIAAGGADRVILTSDNQRSEDPDAIIDEIAAGIRRGSFFRIRDRAEAVSCGVAMMRPGDVLLVAGKGHEEYQEASGVRIRFSDREVVLSALNKRSEHKLQR